MNKLLLLPRNVNGRTFGFTPPTIPSFTDGQKSEPGINSVHVTAEKLIPANPTDTLTYYREVKSEIPDDCYWFSVNAPEGMTWAGVKSNCRPVYHFGCDFFFSGGVNFDWGKNGGVVYEIIE